MSAKVQYVLVRVVADEALKHPMDWDWSRELSATGEGVYAEAWGVSEWIEPGHALDELDLYMPDWERVHAAEQEAVK
jgi:hypothetical protein